MKGIGSYEAYRTDTKEFWPKKDKGVGKKSVGTEKTEGTAAKYEMSDAAKKLAPEKLKEYQKVSVTEQKNVNKKDAADEIELSEAAKELLQKLKEKYGNMDFFVAEFSTDEEAQAYHRQSTKKYSCVIDPKTLEEMAADEKVREKYLSIIDGADEQFDKLKEELGEDVKEVARFGINVDQDGVVTYFAELTKETAKLQKEALEEAKARRAENKAQDEKLLKAREKKKAEEAKKEEKAEPEQKDTMERRFYAASVEELLSKLKDALKERSERKTLDTKPAVGQNFDMTM